MNTIDKTINILLKFLIIVVPIFFLPWTNDYLGIDNFNKSYLLWLVAPVIFTLWLFLLEKRAQPRIQAGFIELTIFIWLIGLGLSALMGVSPLTSFWGAEHAKELPYFTLLSLFLLFLVIRHTADSAERKYEIWRYLVIIYFLVVSVLGGLLLLAALNLLSAESIAFSLAKAAFGTAEQLSIYLSLMTVALITLWLNNGLKEKIIPGARWHFALIILLSLSLMILMIINFFPAWLSLCFGLFTVIIISLFCQGKQNNKFSRHQLAWMIAFIFITVGFSFLSFSFARQASGERRFAGQLQLGWLPTAKVAWQAWGHSPLIGYGGENFSAVNSLFRAKEMNNSPFWHIRYDQGSSYIFGLVIASGTIGVLCWLLLMAAIYFQVIKWLRQGRKQNSEEAGLGILAIGLVAAAIIALLMYSANTVIFFIFFIALALLVNSTDAGLSNKILNIELKDYPGRARVLVIIGFFFIAGWFIIDAIAIRNWAAAAIYQSGAGKRLHGQALLANPGQLALASDLNPSNFQYPLTLARYYQTQAMDNLEKYGPGGKDNNEYNINQAITRAKEARNIAPWEVTTHETLAMIYRDLSCYSNETAPMAAAAFKEAIKLEPTNPVLWTELGILYLEKQRYNDALETLLKSKELKPDYFNTNFNLARVYSAREEYQKALDILDKLTKEYTNVDLLYEHGRVFFNLNRHEEAINRFNQVISLKPLHANALYSLGLSYAALGENKEALYYFKKVIDLNPGNKDVEEKIKDLEK
ncbi:tetratricopeptide repeat protein [Candidatus Parcubacteria bacterium]|nr:tetratricopeptide repeat protein [Candidatus Parcubacteria bacterium]